MDKIPWGEFSTVLGILLIVFRRRFVRSVAAFWEDRHYTESTKKALEILSLIIGIIFVISGIMQLFLPSLFD